MTMNAFVHPTEKNKFALCPHTGPTYGQTEPVKAKPFGTNKNSTPYIRAARRLVQMHYTLPLEKHT